ncbi:MAG TPA: YtxH domain-containing protein [Longimicrobiales bacterium]|nr:YtxH domain-containing protein [Longimicrobiales bacterium]
MGYYDEESQALSFLAGFVLGATLGAGAALLLAPQSGQRTRRQLARAVEDARYAAEDRLEDLSGDLRDAVDSGRRKLNL